MEVSKVNVLIVPAPPETEITGFKLIHSEVVIEQGPRPKYTINLLDEVKYKALSHQPCNRNFS